MGFRPSALANRDRTLSPGLCGPAEKLRSLRSLAAGYVSPSLRPGATIPRPDGELAANAASLRRSRAPWFAALLLSGLAAGGCGLADIRPPVIRDQPIDAAASHRARELLAQVEEAHGGRARYESYTAVTAVARDIWPSAPVRALYMPWPENGTRVRYRFLLRTFTSVAELLDGKRQGETWGIQNWITYKRRPGEPVEIAPDKDITFYLPTYQYFLELPFRLGEAPIVGYAGDAQFDGRTYDLVFATWQTIEPHSEHDQYVLWIDRETRQVGQVQYTVRDIAGFVAGTNRFQDLRQVQGLAVPFLQTITDKPGSDNVLHRLEFESIQFETDTDRTVFFPAPDKSAPKPVPG
jgi:hypothetical protein